MHLYLTHDNRNSGIWSPLIFYLGSSAAFLRPVEAPKTSESTFPKVMSFTDPPDLIKPVFRRHLELCSGHLWGLFRGSPRKASRGHRNTHFCVQLSWVSEKPPEVIGAQLQLPPQTSSWAVTGSMEV